jgi:hypothetical protein
MLIYLNMNLIGQQSNALDFRIIMAGRGERSI